LSPIIHATTKQHDASRSLGYKRRPAILENIFYQTSSFFPASCPSQSRWPQIATHHSCSSRPKAVKRTPTSAVVSTTLLDSPDRSDAYRRRKYTPLGQYGAVVDRPKGGRDAAVYSVDGSFRADCPASRSIPYPIPSSSRPYTGFLRRLQTCWLDATGASGPVEGGYLLR
jgi:hypothetical protein